MVLIGLVFGGYLYLRGFMLFFGLQCGEGYLLMWKDLAGILLWMLFVPYVERVQRIYSMCFMIACQNYVERDGLVEESKFFLEQIKLANVRSTITSLAAKPASQSVVSWCCPPSTWVKINVDGVVNPSTNAAALEGVCRSDSGEWIFCFSRRIGCCSILNAELWAIFYGLQYAWQHGYRRVIIESNCREAVCCVTKGDMAQTTLRDHTLSTVFFEEPPDGIHTLLEYDLQRRDDT
ncbi:hypothetical protein V6N11_084036 [Hibiscus sabdariffa]|uniref:RNase H type-1 domain-containing protein n=1 Tax=Hibiscus sabdariffa TaxID=183260 RepID=A0ABR2QDG4_9ROSI